MTQDIRRCRKYPNRVVSASSAAEASSAIRAGNIDAILLGGALAVDDRTSIALLGVTNGIPVVCMCGVLSEPGCPVVHVMSCDAPAQLLSVLERVLGDLHLDV